MDGGCKSVSVSAFCGQRRLRCRERMWRRVFASAPWQGKAVLFFGDSENTRHPDISWQSTPPEVEHFALEKWWDWKTIVSFLLREGNFFGANCTTWGVYLKFSKWNCEKGKLGWHGIVGGSKIMLQARLVGLFPSLFLVFLHPVEDRWGFGVWNLVFGFWDQLEKWLFRVYIRTEGDCWSMSLLSST